MSDDKKKALPESMEVPDNYEFRGAPWMKIPEDHGEHLVRLAEVVEEITEEIRSNAYDRKQVDMVFGSGEELDYDMINLAIDEFPEAMKDLGEHIEEARSLHEEISEDDHFGEGSNIEYHLSQDQQPEKEQKWLENYREAEDIYQGIFQTLNEEMEENTVAEYIMDRYGINVYHDLEETPPPRPEKR